MIFNYLFF